MDHFALPCLTGQHPLLGPNDAALGARFVPTSNIADKDLQQIVMQSAKELGYDFVRPHGCYAMVSGPTYESATEGKWLRSMGADSVGMSTVPEMIAAHHCGMKVIGLSLVTNKVVMPGDVGPAASHEEVLEEVGKRAGQVQALVERMVQNLKGTLSTMEDLPIVDLTIRSSQSQT